MASGLSLLQLIKSKPSVSEVVTLLESFEGDLDALYPYFDEKDEDGLTCLHHAIRECSPSIVNALLESIPDKIKRLSAL